MVLAGLLAASLLAAQGAAPLASPLQTTTRRPERARGTGAVAYATAERAYLDAGAADGLAPGTTVRLSRAGAAPGGCTVDLVAEHQASCPGKGLRAGDGFSFEPAPEAPGPKQLPALVPDDELARRSAALAAAPAAPRVERRAVADGTRVARLARRAGASLGGGTWSATGSDGLDAAWADFWIRDVEIGAGFRLDVDGRAERWIPDANPRFRPQDETRLYLWQAQLTGSLAAATVSAGRILPHAIPGSTIFDGASASFRLGSLDLGLFGGLVPTPDTLGFTTDRATGGGFWSYQRPFTGGGGFRHDGRLAVVQTPELGTRFEATLGGRAWFRAVDLAAEVQLGAGGEVQAAGYVDAARVDVTARPGRGVTVGASYRHGGLEWPQPFEPTFFPGRGDAADGFVAWDVWALRIGATGGFSRDAVSDLDRTWVGPELGVPRLLGSRLGLAVGYLEETGWLEGRSAYARIQARPTDAITLAARGSWVQETSLGADRDEVGLSVSAAASLGPHLGVRVYALSRMPLGETEGGSLPSGLTVQGAVVGSY
jgi:hypothetical protein